MTAVAIAYDGGPASRAALEWAAGYAGRAGLRLRVASIADPLVYDMSGFDDVARLAAETAVDEAKVWLDENAADLPRRFDVIEGDPLDELLRISAGSELMVVGTNRAGSRWSAPFESFPRKLATLGHGVTVVVPAGTIAPTGPVLVGVGAEEASTAPVDVAARMAAVLRVPLQLAHAWSFTQVPTRIPVPFAAAPSERMLHAQRMIAGEHATEVRRRHPGLTVESISEPGHPVEVLTQHGRAASLIVVGRRRSSTFANWVLGSVAHELLLRMPAPLAIVPTVPPGTAPLPDDVDEALG